MQISVSGRHLHLSKDIQDHAHSKASKLSQFFDKIQKIAVVVSKEGSNYAVEVVVKPDGYESIVGHNSGSDIKACIDTIMDKLGRQITRHKEKIRNHKHRQNHQTQTPPANDE